MVTTGPFAAAEVRATGTEDDRTEEGGVVRVRCMVHVRLERSVVR